ncbi:MAG TPA: universal stress protein [Pseudomonadota bacterium]|nr:universal stress protein [Pseudomonadota bacterium]
MTPKHIAVATDLSPSSSAALRFALNLAAPLGAQVTLLHAIEPTPMPGGLEAFALEGMPVGWEQRVTQARVLDAERRLAEQARQGGAAGAVKTRLIVGSLPDAILEQLAPLGIDLLVVGTHGRRGLAHFFLGSAAERLLRGASCPVVVVRPDEAPAS